MEKILEKIKNFIKCNENETYTNIVYSIRDDDIERKASLKALLPANQSTEPFTTVKIDFVAEVLKKSKKQKLKERMYKIKDEKAPTQSPCIAQEKQELPLIAIENSPIFLYGEYIKLSREMSQTPLVIGGQLKTERSVSDFTEEFKCFFQADDVCFLSCGREDIDVRCLEGRPFLLTVRNPKRNLDARIVAIKMYRDVHIINLCAVDQRAKNSLTSDESNKFYLVDIFSGKKINFSEKYELDQKTPLRVLHRRANMIRNKTIEILNVIELNKPEGYYYEVRIRASSGAYIKEWVSGDFSRTTPNLNADCLNLDVVRVDRPFDTSCIKYKIDLMRRDE
ncbi:tRNA pseudouridine synthase 10 [Enteropsectra breve]|nr:tRNA pseudouridine synthase 10 [Enteropsectra breve]